VTLLSLLSCTGLRISEALGLTMGDVDLQEGILLVRESKFHKSRAIPLHPSAVRALKRYRQTRNGMRHSAEPDSSFFMNECRRPLSYSTVCATFLEIARHAGVRAPAGQRGPRIHDLRHSFAVGRLLAWYRDGGNVQARLPLLATYLGHVSIVSTQVYLDMTPDLLKEAAKRFMAPRLNGAPHPRGTP
jgi:integrase